MDVVVDGPAKVLVDGVCVANCGGWTGSITDWALITSIIVLSITACILLFLGWLDNWGRPTEITSQLTTQINPGINQHLVLGVDIFIEEANARKFAPRISVEFLRMLSDTPIQTPE